MPGCSPTAPASRSSATRPFLAYGPGGGYGPLRELLAARHGVDPGRVLLTAGALQGFLFYAEELLEARPGRVLVEAPTYDRPLKLLARLGAEVRAVEMDDEGLDPEALAHDLADGPVSFLYTIPTFQNPSGRTLTSERRLLVAELAARHDVPVLEDDPYGLVRYEGEAPPSLFELEGGSRVTYASSFSKTVAPGLRVGWFVAPADLAARLEARAVSTYISPAFLTEATVHELIDRGSFEPNLERIRSLLRLRRDAMLDALRRELGGRATWSEPEGGYFTWLELPADAAELLARAEAAGVTFVKGADFYPDRDAARRGRATWEDGGQPVSPSATRRRRRSTRASPCSGRSSPDAGGRAGSRARRR